jgi:hypothetical protein
MERKYKSKFVESWQEYQVIRMYKKGFTIKDVAAATYLSRNLVTRILDAHGIRKIYNPSESKRLRGELPKGTIIQQCAEGASERHKRINELFRPTMTA